VYLESLALPAAFRVAAPVITLASGALVEAGAIQSVFERLDVPEELEAAERAAVVAAALVRALGEERTAAQVSVQRVWACR